MVVGTKVVVVVVVGPQGPLGVTITVPGTVRGLSVSTQIFVSPGNNTIASCSPVIQSVIMMATGSTPVLSKEKLSQGAAIVVDVVVVVAPQHSPNVLYILIISPLIVMI